MADSKETVREAVKQDLNGILTLNRSVFKYDRKYITRYYQKFFGADPVVREDNVFVADLEGAIVGVCGYAFDYFSTDNSVWLGWFAVMEKHRGSGIGNRLYQRVEQELKRSKIKRLFVSTEDENEIAMKFYLAQGFVFEARLRDFYCAGGDQIILSKYL